MKCEIKCLASLVALLALSTGCMNTSRYKSLPVDWSKAIEPSPNPSLDISGLYTNGGRNRGVRNDVGSPILQDLFVTREDLSERGITVEILQRDFHTLEVTIWNGSKTLARKSVVVEADAATGALILPSRNASLAHGQGLMAMAGSTVVRLFKGSDGYLYAQFQTSRAGVVFGVLPMGQSEEGWVRWSPAAQQPIPPASHAAQKNPAPPH